MPNMARFIEEGVIGNLATLSPELSPMLWTSIATGKRPFKHGILGFAEPSPDGEGLRPITNISRKTKAIWNILSQSGKKCNVVSWWPSHPAEPINGVMVSNHYHRAVAPHGKPWPLRPGTVHPVRLTRNLAALRVHPQEIDAALIMNFVPRLAEIDQEKDTRIETLGKIVAECTTVNKAATALMIHEPWDFTAVYFDSIDHFCHAFMNCHAPRLPWIDEKDFGLYKDVVVGGYIYHDILLGALLELTDDNTTVMIVSDHGFHSDHLRPRHIPMEPAGPAAQHRAYGILAVKGPGVLKDEILYGASLLDICPTVLSVFGLPVGEDMDGKPLVNIFRSPPGVLTVPTWDDIPGSDGSHPPDRKIDPVEAREAIHQLVELGYIEMPDEDRAKAAEESVRELRYNLARSLMDAGLHLRAVPVLKELLDGWPDEYRFGILLVNCYEAAGRIREARTMLEDLFARKKKNSVGARLKLKEFLDAHKGVSFPDLSVEDRQTVRRLRGESSLGTYAMDYLMGSLLAREGKEKEALVYLARAAKKDAGQPGLYVSIGEVYLKMRKWLDAKRSFRKALSIDPEHADAHAGLARVYLGVRKNVDAAEEALTAVGLRYHNPEAHCTLGAALHRMGRPGEALQALTIAVGQNPHFPEAHRRLALIYKKRLKDDLLSKKHAELARESRARIRAFRTAKLESLFEKEIPRGAALTSAHEALSPQRVMAPEGPVDMDRTIVVVSGLPRSGTSMMMQMLEAGGMPLFTDGIRAADRDNPRGYLEYEKTRQLRRDSAWLPDARGRAVKVIAQLLADLPRLDGLGYVVIFMERDPEEVIQSQRAMLARRGKKGSELPGERLREIFSQQVRQAKLVLATRKIPTLFVSYENTVQEPTSAVARLTKVFGGLDMRKMADAVDPALRRQKRA
jgi:predicted AlkP superfamily phosphohydrolase/phosphomutase/tetratricopeptide (TPR) repeat protein